jgi:cutinase
VASCPDTKIVLGGYSQGANIVNIVAGNPIVGIAWGAALPSSLAGNVAAIATFGNVANRAGTKLPSATALFAGKAIDLCNPADPICHAGPGNAWSGHTTGYVPDYTTQAAAFASAQLLAGTSQVVPGFGQAPGSGQFPGYASPPPGSDHMPPGYATQSPQYDPSKAGYNPSVVVGLP